MRSVPFFVSALGIVMLMTGCSTQRNPPTNVGTNSHSYSEHSTTEASGEQPSSQAPPWPNANWVLTDALMKQEKWMTEYNQNLSINKGVYGKTSTYSDWKIPSNWKPYLYKQEQYITPKTGPMYLNRQTLFITLQGTVYLKEGVAGRFWDPFSAMDIPPDATIVAEFVPLKPAVKAGIIPVYHGPQAGGGYIEPKVLKVLGMTEKEFQTYIGNPKGQTNK